MSGVRQILILVPLLFAGQAWGNCAGLLDPIVIPSGKFQIGYEAEYTFDEAKPILRDFGPSEISPSDWTGMSDEQHLEWLKKKYSRKLEYTVDADLRPVVALPVQVQELVIDATGNLEIVTAPFSGFDQWSQAVQAIVQRYGAGSQQAMISKPRSAAFPDNGKAAVNEHLGWFVYTGLRDMFAKLRVGYQRYQKSPDKLTALSFDHPYVGPMNKIRFDSLKNFLSENQFGRLYDDEAKTYVRQSDASFKFTGGPSYRPDIAGPGRFAWELRNSHKDFADLQLKVRRDIVAHSTDMIAYARFAQVTPFDSVTEFAQLPAVVQKSLVDLFPSKACSDFTYEAAELSCLETHRNFALPLMDFATLAQALSKNEAEAAGLRKSIARGQLAYRTNLLSATTDFAAHRLTPTQAKALIMGLIGRFAVDSGIAEAFDAAALRIGHEYTQIASERKTGS